jgi:dolichol kinase
VEQTAGVVRSRGVASETKGLRREAARKAFHVASVGLPLAVWLLPRPVAVGGMAGLAATAIIVDVVRLRHRGARYHFLRRTRTMLRTHERYGLAGATYMVVAYALAVVLLPRPLAVAAMLYNGLGDAAAALVGKRFGRHRTRWGKSWEGFAAALVTNLAVGFLVPGVTPAGALLGAGLAAILEFLPLPLDDNLRVTLGGGAGAWLGGLLG